MRAQEYGCSNLWREGERKGLRISEGGSNGFQRGMEGCQSGLTYRVQIGGLQKIGCKLTTNGACEHHEITERYEDIG